MKVELNQAISELSIGTWFKRPGDTKTERDDRVMLAVEPCELNYDFQFILEEDGCARVQAFETCCKSEVPDWEVGFTFDPKWNVETLLDTALEALYNPADYPQY